VKSKWVTRVSVWETFLGGYMNTQWGNLDRPAPFPKNNKFWVGMESIMGADIQDIPRHFDVARLPFFHDLIHVRATAFGKDANAKASPKILIESSRTV
jgi:hypothetical protein